MSTHNICFCGEMRRNKKTIYLNTFLSGAMILKWALVACINMV